MSNTTNIKTMTSKIVGNGKGQRIVPFPAGHNVISISGTGKPREVLVEYVERKARAAK